MITYASYNPPHYPVHPPAHPRRPTRVAVSRGGLMPVVLFGEAWAGVGRPDSARPAPRNPSLARPSCGCHPGLIPRLRRRPLPPCLCSCCDGPARVSWPECVSRRYSATSSPSPSSTAVAPLPRFTHSPPTHTRVALSLSPRPPPASLTPPNREPLALRDPFQAPPASLTARPRPLRWPPSLGTQRPCTPLSPTIHPLRSQAPTSLAVTGPHTRLSRRLSALCPAPSPCPPPQHRSSWARQRGGL